MVKKKATEIAYQEHSKFKVFVGMLTKSKSIGVLANKVAKFADEQQIAAKSIGVEYLENPGQLLITLGYRDDEPYYPIQLHCSRLGKIDVLGGDYTALERAMEKVAQKYSNIICHELYATEEHELLMIVMTHA
ncbi:MAG TPA: hypothetical protein VNM90_08015 [Haliangium sp.]|nr:hypothetical protein [Haliangium sp.]